MYLFKRKDTKYWWFTFMHKRKRYQFTTSETDRKAAEKVAKEMQEQILKERKEEANVGKVAR